MMIRILSIILLITFLSVPLVKAEISVVKLSYANPDSVLTILKSIYGRKLEASSAKMINAIVVRTNDKNTLLEIKKLLKSLDRRPSILRFTVQNLSNTTFRENSFNTSNKRINVRYSKNSGRNSNQVFHSVSAMEFQKASLANSISRVVPMGYEGATTLTANRGLDISGHLANPNSVVVNLWFSAGNFSDAATLITTVNAPLGKWVQIGTNNRKDNTSPTTSTSIYNSNIDITRREKHINTEQNFLIKVDLIQTNH